MKFLAILAVATVAVVGGMFLLSGSSQPASPAGGQTDAGVREGDVAPDFSLRTTDDRIVRLHSLRGQPVLFAFVLTVGCAPCAIEAQNVRAAQEQVPFKVVQIGISPQEKNSDLVTFRKQLGRPDWLMGFDREGTIAERFEVKNIDTTIVVDAEGKIIFRDDGYPVETEKLVEVLKET